MGKKKFPLPRHRSRKSSQYDAAGSGCTNCIINTSIENGSQRSDSSNRSRSSTPRGLRNLKSSFPKFGRKKSKNKDPNNNKSNDHDNSIIEDSDRGGSSLNSSLWSVSSHANSVDGDDDEIIAVGDVVDPVSAASAMVTKEPLPPMLPPMVTTGTMVVVGSTISTVQKTADGRTVPPTPRSTTAVQPTPVMFDEKVENNQSQEPSSASTTTKAAAGIIDIESPTTQPPPSPSPSPLPVTLIPATRTRSLTPSDYHYHTTPNGGINAHLTPISAHYATNKSLLDLFSTLYEKDQFSVAYAVGIKFVEVALFQIPTHSYYKSGSADSKERTKSAADAVRVTKLLGGMMDEMDDDADGGIEKVETLSKLANVAHQSFEEALDMELKEGATEVKDEEDVSPVQRIWNEYVMGMGKGSGDGPNPCAGGFDNICSFWNFRNGCEGVDDSTMDEEEQVKKKPKVEEGKKPKVEQITTRKKPKVEHIPTALLPEPVTIPQVFIPRAESGEARVDEKHSDTGKDGTPYGSDVADGVIVAKRVSTDTSDSEISQEVMLTEESEEANFVGSEPQRTPGPIVSEELDDTSMDDAMYNEATPVAMNKSVVLKGEPVEPLRQRMDSEGFDKDALELAIIMSKRCNPAINVSPSPSSDTVRSTMSVDEQRKDVTRHIDSLVLKYEEQYHTLRDKNQFHVRFLDTFQGRNPHSTNGCTVIAPLTCIQYFCSVEQNTSVSLQETTWENGILDELINHVIDEHAATVLPEVRSKLNLQGDAFIIPSDVHDHLIDVGLLSTSQFVGVCGGNILDDEHLSSFKNSLFLLDDERERERLKGRKIAATFFFHGHVIALHVVDSGRKGDGPWVELIDSLPDPEAWVRPPSEQRHISRVSPDSMECEDEQRDPSENGEWEQPISYDEYELPQNAVRIRCKGVEHFDTLLRHYACSKFSEEERAFIDRTMWDDSNSYCDSAFDPRIFQAFIWAEAE
mmetsp:Transcript_20418/g.42686  ORF Transcript_20418/g.42686 Transcript_20418/m.42686 type:complete len:971 (+) Transcript_20418:98-3010(+)